MDIKNMRNDAFISDATPSYTKVKQVKLWDANSVSKILLRKYRKS